MRIKDRQIAEKDKQLDQQQQLTLQAMKDQENLKLELDQAKEEVQSTKKGFLLVYLEDNQGAVWVRNANLMASLFLNSIVAQRK